MSKAAGQSAYNMGFTMDKLLPRPMNEDGEPIEYMGCAVTSINRGGVLSVSGIEAPALGTMVRIHSTVPGVGPVDGIVIRIHSDQVFVAILAQSHQVAVGDRVTPLLHSHQVATTDASATSNSPSPTASSTSTSASASASAHPSSSSSHVWPTFPVGPRLLGRVLDPLGRPLDGAPLLHRVDRVELRPGVRTPADAPMVARLPAGAPLLTGIKHIDMFHPLRKGLRVALVGSKTARLHALAVSMIGNIVEQNRVASLATPASGSSSRSNSGSGTSTGTGTGTGSGSLSPVAPEGASLTTTTVPPVFVYVSVGRTSRHVQEVISLLADAGALPYTTLIVADQSDPPILQHLAFQAGAALANYYQARGSHALAVFDDVGAHGKAYYALCETFNLPASHVVGSVQSQVLESFAQLGPSHGSGSSTALCLLEERAEQPGLDSMRAKAVLDNLHITADHVISTDQDLAAARLWPPVEVSANVKTLRFQIPVVRQLVQQLNQLLAQSRDAFERSRVGDRLGLQTDEEMLELIEWRPKVQLLLTQSPQSYAPLHEQFMMLRVAARPRLLAGIAVHKMRALEAYVLERTRTEKAEMMSALAAAMTTPQTTNLSPALEQEIDEWADRVQEEYALAYPSIE